MSRQSTYIPCLRSGCSTCCRCALIMTSTGQIARARASGCRRFIKAPGCSAQLVVVPRRRGAPLGSRKPDTTRRHRRRVPSLIRYTHNPPAPFLPFTAAARGTRLHSLPLAFTYSFFSFVHTLERLGFCLSLPLSL